MKANEAESNAKTSGTTHRAARYTKVKDARKRPIRGLWCRGNRFYARLAIEDDAGRTKVRRIPLIDPETQKPAETPAQALSVMERLKVHRSDNTLPVLSRTPKFSDFADRYFEHFKQLKDAKRPRTIEKEESSIRLWREAIGELRLDKIRKAHVTSFMAKRQGAGLSGRTVNLDVIALRNVLKKAIDDGYLKSLPTENLRPLKSVVTKRQLITHADIEAVCAAALEVSKNGQEFADYIRTMAYCGSRRDETMRLKWQDVDFERQQLTIGADGLAKNHQSRVVDFNPKLEGLLKDMQGRQAPDSSFLFPSPQRGEKDVPIRTFKETLNLVRESLQERQIGPNEFTFHDCRHFFISFCVMSGIDFMTIARWVGHQDGGVLIGKVYGHLASEHTKAQAARVSFGPTVVSPVNTAIQ
jgi:integrase